MEILKSILFALIPSSVAALILLVFGTLEKHIALLVAFTLGVGPVLFWTAKEGGFEAIKTIIIFYVILALISLFIYRLILVSTLGEI